MSFFFVNYFRAFKSILKCQRIKPPKPSPSFYRISAALNERSRRKRSSSWGLSATRSVRKSTPVGTQRTLSDVQNCYRPSISGRNSISNCRRASRLECIANTALSKSDSTPHNTSPWHLRSSVHVRSF